MKKNILKFSLALAVVVAAGYTVCSSQTSVQLIGTALENVEALASDEWGPYETSHSSQCPPPVEYKTSVSCTDGGWEFCYPSDC